MTVPSPSFPTNLYEVLNVSQTATSREIRQAYRKRALECHPDKLTSNRDHVEDSHSQYITPYLPPFSVLHDATQLLLDPVRRHLYNVSQLLYDVRSRGRCASDEVYFLLHSTRVTELDTSHLCKKLISELSEVNAGVEVFPGGITSFTKEFEVVSSDGTHEHHSVWATTDVDDDMVFSLLGEEKGDTVPVCPNIPQYLWCRFECRCGGSYLIEIPFTAAFSFKPTTPSQHSIILYGLKVVHVECESCSLVITVNNVPFINHFTSSEGTDREGVNRFSYSNDIEKRYRDLFPK
eukprot:Tbor_TRINITY_DN711_c0_g1::TRINITY_DN711_c0_g1_i1::g.3306::m.3306